MTSTGASERQDDRDKRVPFREQFVSRPNWHMVPSRDDAPNRPVKRSHITGRVHSSVAGDSFQTEGEGDSYVLW